MTIPPEQPSPVPEPEQPQPAQQTPTSDTLESESAPVVQTPETAMPGSEPARDGRPREPGWALIVPLLLLVLVVAGAALASTALFYRFDDITAGAVEPLFFASELRGETMRAILYHLPPAAALVTLGILVSVLSGSPAMAARASRTPSTDCPVAPRAPAAGTPTSRRRHRSPRR